MQRGVFCLLGELKVALDRWIKTWNDDARPVKCTKTDASPRASDWMTEVRADVLRFCHRRIVR